ncbi:MAG: Rap1a/Tai family immunity protein [Gammaproteobacteria bacterium]
MNRKSLNFLLGLALLTPGLTQAVVSKDDFLARTTQNLINLCTASPDDPNYREAIHFCHGYLIGALHFHLAETENKPNQRLVCFPEPKPSRNQGIEMFVQWTKQHPEYMKEPPVETEFRFLNHQWPCVN